MINIDCFKKWIELDLEVKQQPTEESVTMYLPISSYNNVFITNNKNYKRSFSIEFSHSTIYDYKPRNVNGISIEIKKNDMLNKDRLYLVLSNNYKEHDDTFIGFSAFVFDALLNSISDIDSLKRIEKVLEEYHNFFGYEKKISKDKEQGLMAELIYLNELIDKDGEFRIINWFGSEKNKRDFIFDNYGVEIKSTRYQEQDIIHVSNENQLDAWDFDKLLLKLYIFDENELGQDVSFYIRLIYSKLISFEIKKIFLAKVSMREIDPLSYEGHYKFRLESIHTYIVDDKFPKITKRDIPANAFDVKYRLNLSGIAYLEKE